MLSALFAVQASAQDDMYFVPKKQPKQVSSNVPFAGKTYYSGISKTDDEYNRRAQRVIAGIRVANDSIIYSPDSIASDVITFTLDKPQLANAKQRDTVYVYVTDDDDFSYCRYISRFDDFYWFNRFGGPAWYSPWYLRWGYYDPWFASAYYSPYWCAGYYGGWYDPWFYDPFYIGSWGYPYYYGGYYSYWPGPGGSGIHHYPTTSGHSIAYRGSHNHHFGGNSEGKTGFAHRTTTGGNANYQVANRNGGGTTYATGARGTGYRSERYEQYRTNGYDHNLSYRSSSSSSYSSSGGGYSGGGHSSGGGFSGGGHSGGGGGSHSGGSFGSGRR